MGNRRDRQVVQLEINPEHGEGQKRTAEGNEIQKKQISVETGSVTFFSEEIINFVLPTSTHFLG